jgi:hypothetical protein
MDSSPRGMLCIVWQTLLDFNTVNSVETSHRMPQSAMGKPDTAWGNPAAVAISRRFAAFSLLSQRNGSGTNVNHRLVELQFHGPAKSGMVFVVQCHKTKGLQAAGGPFL